MMKSRSITRRQFLKAAGLASAGVNLAGCTPAATTPAPATTAATLAGTIPTAAPTAAPTVAPTVAQEKVKVTVWGWWEERMKIFQDAGNDFMQKNPNIEVAVETFPGDEIWPKIYASVPAGTGPTLMKMQTTNFFKMRDEDLLVPLPADVFPDSFLREKYPGFPWDAFGPYCIPEGDQPALFTYNKKAFTEAGLDPDKPPRTWDEFFAAGKKLTTRDSNGTITRAGVQFDSWLPVLNPLYQLGGNLVKRNGESLTASFASPEMEQALQFFVDAAQTHKIWDPNFPYYSDAIGNEQAAMSIGEAWVYGTWKSDFPDTFKNLGFAAPPTPSGDAKPYFGRKNAVLNLALVKNRPPAEMEAGLKFLEYLIKERTDTQFALANISGIVPSRAEVLSSDQVTGDPFMSLGASLTPKMYDTVEVGDPLDKLMTDTLNKILLEGQSVTAAMEYGQAELQKLIDSGEVKHIQ